MATNPQKRENLLQEATAYSRRILISLVDISFRGVSIRELFAGVRRDGRWSLYFDESPVIQFNQQESIRRLYVEGRNFVAAAGTLVELVRRSQGGKVENTPRPVREEEHRLLMTELQQTITRTFQQLELSQSHVNRQQTCSIAGVFPIEDRYVYDDLLIFLSRRQFDFSVALSLNN